MNKLLKTLLLILLLTNGVSAVYGGWHMIDKPDGTSLNLPLQYLRYTPFNDYLLPGILLFSMIGMYSIALFAMVMGGAVKYGWLLIIEGVVLSLWIIAQLIYRIPFSTLHGVFLFISVIFIYTGMLKLRTSILS
ncbi:hypothetical protein WG904_12695 [Pedobacter sp. Du54]|uniref:hypothetical protein n=1 Tax=Pedobacter anseongensis TaxID=3133439 RepID=UPI0030AA3E04